MTSEWPKAYQPEVMRPFFGRLSSSSIALEAWRRGLTVTLLDAQLRKYRIADAAGNRVTFIRSRPARTSLKAVRSAGNKHTTNRLLSAAGLPVPQSYLIASETSETDLVALADKLGYPVVLKPPTGSQGKGVFSNIQNERELLDNYALIRDHYGSEEAVLESHATGDDIRVLVLKDTVIAACRRQPPNIVGDGIRTVDDLIIEKNRERKRNPFLASGLIKYDHEINANIAGAGFSPSSVLPAGHFLQLRSKANASAGGETVDLTGRLPSEVCEAAVMAVQAIPGLQVAGVDVLYDSSRSSFTIIEVNATVQIGVNMYPTEGNGVDVPKAWIDHFFPDSKRSAFLNGNTLSFSLETPLKALREGSTSSITLAPAPHFHLPHRSLHHLSPAPNISRRNKKTIYAAANKTGVSGFIATRGDEHFLLVAAESESSSKTFLETVSELLECEVGQRRPWSGPVRLGFHFETRRK